MTSESPATRALRNLIARTFAAVEDLVYIGLGLLLAGSAISLLISTGAQFGTSVFSGDFSAHAIPLLDRILLILLVVELLYTVQVSFRQHAVTPEPFLLVGLIAAIRRVLILTAEFGAGAGGSGPQPPSSQLILELAVLSGLIVAIAVSLFVLRRRDTVDKIAKP